MPSVPNTYLADSSSQVWQLGATGVGAYTTTAVSGPAGLPFINLTDLVTDKVWALSVLTSGALEIQSTASPSGAPSIPVLAPTGTLFGIVVMNDAISVIRLPQACANAPVVGEIFKPLGYVPPFTQPGGPGTVVFPQQDSGALATSQWILGCGHGVNNFEIVSCTSCASSNAGIQIAALLCPLCHYCQTLFSPYSIIQSYPWEILFP